MTGPSRFPAAFLPLAFALVLALPAMAQKLTTLTLDVSSVAEGRPVTARLDFDVPSGTNCGMRLHWGDGQSDDFKINQRKDVPWIASHSYARAGRYEIMAEPKTQGLVPRCGGDNQRSSVRVSAVAPAVTAAAPVVPAAAASQKGAVPKAVVTNPAHTGGVCPVGWRLGASGIDAKTKGFTCIAAPNTKLPVQRLSCPGELSYYENAKKGELGCRP